LHSIIYNSDLESGVQLFLLAGTPSAGGSGFRIRTEDLLAQKPDTAPSIKPSYPDHTTRIILTAPPVFDADYRQQCKDKRQHDASTMPPDLKP